MSRGYFITGTDTGVGKTRVSAALLYRLQQTGITAAGMKPVASGCRRTPHGLRNDDAELLQRYSGITLPYDSVNPYAFEPAIAPHLAAAEIGATIDIAVIRHRYAEIAARCACVIVEGAGGWLTPVDTDRTLADVAAALQLPVILVVGVRLGCINHALLTQAAVAATGLPLAGWVANHIDPACERQDAIVTSLARSLGAPCLGRLNHAPESDIPASAAYLSLP